MSSNGRLQERWASQKQAQQEEVGAQIGTFVTSARHQSATCSSIRDLAGDFGDLDYGEFLAVPGTAPRILAAAELLDNQFFALALANHTGSHGGSVDRGLAQTELFAIGDSQHAVKHQLAAWLGGFPEIDLEGLSFLDFILMTTVNDDCVHESDSETN